MQRVMDRCRGDMKGRILLAIIDLLGDNREIEV